MREKKLMFINLVVCAQVFVIISRAIFTVFEIFEIDINF